MQVRMKEHQLSPEEINKILKTEQVGNLGTMSPKGFPYITPVHFVLIDNKIFVHGLNKGSKLNNIKMNSNVGFEIYKYNNLIHDQDLPCDTNTNYQSVIILGLAKLIDDEAIKIKVLDEVVNKYTPQHSGKSFPPAMIKATGIIEITPLSTTGKYYK